MDPANASVKQSSNVWNHTPSETAKAKGPLLPRLGGEEVLIDYIDGLYDNMLANPTLGHMLKSWMQTAPPKFYMQHLKDRTVDYLAVVWGGDAWEGQDLFVAHAHLHITPEMFDLCIKCGHNKLKKMKLSKDLINEVLEQMQVMKYPITDPEGKFQAWIRKRQKELEEKTLAEGAVMGPMGFSVSKKVADDMERRKREQVERKERMAQEKAKRLAHESAAKKEGKKEKKTKQEGNDKKGQSKSNTTTEAGITAESASPTVSACPSREATETLFVPEPILPEDGEPGIVPASHTTPLLLCAA